jgi:hypothetical protein
MMAKWKYDPNELKVQHPNALLKEVSFRWFNVLKIEKDIREKILKNAMPHLTKVELKDAMEKHENRKTPRLECFDILEYKVEEVVQSTINMWKTFYVIVDNKGDEKEAPSVHTSDHSNYELIITTIIASLPSSLISVEKKRTPTST